MKRKILSLILIILTFTAIVYSVCMVDVSNYPFKQYGIPAYVLAEEVEIGMEVNYVTRISFESLTVILVFFGMSIPIFMAGYLWRKPKNKNPNKSSEPT